MREDTISTRNQHEVAAEHQLVVDRSVELERNEVVVADLVDAEEAHRELCGVHLEEPTHR